MKAPKPSEYPKVVRIGQAEIPYKIKFVNKPRSTWLGKCSYEKRTIWLNKNQTREALFMAYLHELCHAIEFESGDRIPHKIIYRFESGLYSFIKNNLVSFKHRR
jgi:hypothetical protein